MKTWAAAVLCLFGAACQTCKSTGSQPVPVPGTVMGTLTVTSNAFSSSRAIPVDYTCDGADKSPHLAVSAPPTGTGSFAIIVEDPDAAGGNFTHWIAYNLPSGLRVFPEAADAAALGGTAGTNDFNRPGYTGPCPPRGEIHRYFFRIFALDGPINVRANPTREAVDRAMNGHALAAGALVGVFSH